MGNYSTLPLKGKLPQQQGNECVAGRVPIKLYLQKTNSRARLGLWAVTCQPVLDQGRGFYCVVRTTNQGLLDPVLYDNHKNPTRKSYSLRLNSWREQRPKDIEQRLRITELVSGMTQVDLLSSDFRSEYSSSFMPCVIKGQGTTVPLNCKETVTQRLRCGFSKLCMARKFSTLMILDGKSLSFTR